MKRINSTRLETLESRVVLSANIVTAGDPDVAFGNMGRAVIDLGNQNDTVSDLLALPGGSTLVLGRHFDAGTQPVSTLVRLDAAGAVDGTFGSSGVVVIEGDAGLGVSPRSI